MNVSRNPVAQAQSAVVQGLAAFKTALEARSGGLFEVRLLWNTLEVSDDEAERAQLLGDKVHLIVQPASVLAPVTSALLPLGIWRLFSYPDLATPRAFIESEAAADLGERVAGETGLRILAFWEEGYRHLVLTGAAGTPLEDLRNRRVVSYANPVQQQILVRLGAKPLVLPRVRLHELLRRQEADGVDSTLTEIEERGFDELSGSLLLTGHAFEFLCVMASERLYSNLSAEERRWWREAIQEATTAYRQAFSLQAADQLERVARRLVVRRLPDADDAHLTRQARHADSVAQRMAGQDVFQQLVKAAREAVVPVGSAP